MHTFVTYFQWRITSDKDDIAVYPNTVTTREVPGLEVNSTD